jgi:hypothetical protein
MGWFSVFYSRTNMCEWSKLLGRGLDRILHD